MASAEAQQAQRPRAESPAPKGTDKAGPPRPGDRAGEFPAKPLPSAQAQASPAARAQAPSPGSAVGAVLMLAVALGCSAGAYFDVDPQDIPFESLTNTAFANSLAMTIVTELGDKTFFIAALLAMRHGPKQVFLGAYTALVAMTIISASLGHVSSALLSPKYTHWAATVLFIYFAAAALFESARLFRAGEGKGPSDELEEVKQSLKDDARKGASAVLQALSLTFLAEWGDKSQVGTIALSSAGSPVAVTFGGIIGHFFCSSLAVFGGHAFAERISERVVLAIAGSLFLGFGVLGVVTGGPQ